MFKIIAIIMACLASIANAAFQVAYFADADAELTKLGVPAYLLPSRRFDTEEYLAAIRCYGPFSKYWNGYIGVPQNLYCDREPFPEDPVMQLLNLLFPSPNGMFLPAQGISDPISELTFAQMGQNAALRLLAKPSEHKNWLVFKDEFIRQAISSADEEMLDSNGTALKDAGEDSLTSDAKKLEYIFRTFLPHFFQRRGEHLPFMEEGDIERLYAANEDKSQAAKDSRRRIKNNNFLYSLHEAKEFISNTDFYPKNIIEQMFLVFAFRKAKTVDDLAAFYNAYMIAARDNEETKKSTIVDAKIFNSQISLQGHYQRLSEQADKSAYILSLPPEERALTIRAMQLFDMSYLQVLNMGEATFTPTGGKTNQPIKFPDCVETAMRNYVLACVRRVNETQGIVYDSSLLPKSAAPELRAFVGTYNTLEKQATQEARDEWVRLISQRPEGVRYKKPTNQPEIFKRKCEIKSGHLNILKVFGVLLGSDFMGETADGVEEISDEQKIIEAHKKICAAFNERNPELNLSLTSTADDLDTDRKISDVTGNLTFTHGENNLPLFTFAAESQHGETKAAEDHNAPQFLQDFLLQRGCQEFANIFGVNILARIVTKDNVQSAFDGLHPDNKKVFLPLVLKRDASILVKLVEGWRDFAATPLEIMQRCLTARAMLSIDDDRATNLFLENLLKHSNIDKEVAEILREYGSQLLRSAYFDDLFKLHAGEEWVSDIVANASVINSGFYKNIASPEITDGILNLVNAHNTSVQYAILGVRTEENLKRVIELLNNAKGLQILDLAVANKDLAARVVPHIPASCNSITIYDEAGWGQFLEADNDAQNEFEAWGLQLLKAHQERGASVEYINGCILHPSEMA